MRKLFSLFLALVATTSLWAQTFQVGFLSYNITSSSAPYTVEVSDAVSYITSFIILETVTYNGTTYSVTSIGDEAFDYCKALTSITIPNSVTSIGDRAFEGCYSLTSITIPNSVTSIGDEAFAYCTSLTSITIPNSVTTVGGGMFIGCSKLKSVVLSNNITSLPSYGVGLTYGFFEGCSSLTSITIPNSVTSIGDEAFAGCSSLTSITIGNSVTSIGIGAFHNCSSLTSITIPNSVTSIGDRAFEGCSSLTSITIPNSVTSIGDYAFSGCSSLTTPVYNAHCFAYMPTSFKGAYVIPEGIKQIAGGAFEGCSSLTSITIPNSVTSIGNYAFSGCSSLTSVTIGNSVTSIGDWTFYDCSSLTSVTIPESVTSIGWGAFLNCSSLTSVTIPNSVTSIGDDAFAFCTSLTSITIPNSVTSIGHAAFRDCTSLTTITIPNSVTSIEGWAFRDCSALTSITIPNSVTSIGEYTFYGCSSLTSITIPNSVTSIGSSAFSGCSSLTSITIPNSVTSIEDEAFWYCSSLTKTNYTGDIAGWCAIKFGNSSANPMCCSHNFFINDQKIKDLVIPNSITSIGGFTFYGCFSLTSITCEATTPPTVGEYAFYDVSKSIPVYVPCGYTEAYKAANRWKNFTNIQEALAEYSIEVDVNDNIMGTATVNINSMCGAHISATANIGYHFVQWSDGNTDNPRTLTLTQDTVLTAEFALTIAGQCGDNLYWSYNESDQTISITGSGKMYDYTADTQPWFLFEEQIMEVVTSNTATSIGTSAFEGCLRLDKVSLGAAMENVAANAFAGCTRLYHIYCYPTDPPFADESSFANYNVYLHVPCNNKEEYDLDIIWGNFKYIECLSADEVEDTEDVIIESGTTTVIITWPTEGNADTYTIVIKKDGEVFCTLTFNAEGQLLNIAFAPGRNGNHPVQYAEAVANGGYRFTVTGLTESTDYTYNITVKDAANKTIKSHSGKFTTESLTAVENTHRQSPISNCQKLLRDGQLIIIRDGVEYNAMGAQIQ